MLGSSILLETLSSYSPKNLNILKLLLSPIFRMVKQHSIDILLSLDWDLDSSNLITEAKHIYERYCEAIKKESIWIQ